MTKFLILFQVYVQIKNAIHKEFRLDFPRIGLFTVFRIFLFIYGVFTIVGEGKWLVECSCVLPVLCRGPAARCGSTAHKHKFAWLYRAKNMAQLLCYRLTFNWWAYSRLSLQLICDILNCKLNPFYFTLKFKHKSFLLGLNKY